MKKHTQDVYDHKTNGGKRTVVRRTVVMPNFEMPNLDSVNHCTSDFLTGNG